MTKEQLLARRQALAGKIRALAPRVDEWTAGERTTWDTLNAEYDDVALQLDRINAEDPPLNRSPRIGRDGGRIGDAGAFRPHGTDVDLALSGFIRNSHGEPIPVAEMEAAHRIGMDPRGGAFALHLPTGLPTRGLTVHNAGGSIDGTAGGYAVPGVLMTTLVSAMKAFGPMTATSDVWITSDGRDTGWPTCDDTSNTGSQVGENTDVGSATDLAFGQIVFHNYKMTSGVLKVSHELLRDSALNLTQVVGQKLGERLGRIVNTKATAGTGAATLTGIVTAANAGKTAASATAIAFDELIELQHSIDPAYRVGPGVGWMMHDNIASYVRRLKDGEGNYLWQDAVQEGQPPRLLGYPVHINQDMASSIASGEKTVLFGKLDEYKLRIVSGVRLRRLEERYAEYDQTGFIAFLECDGGLMKPSTTASLCPVRYLQQA